MLNCQRLLVAILSSIKRPSQPAKAMEDLVRIVRNCRGIELNLEEISKNENATLIQDIERVAHRLTQLSYSREADVLLEVKRKCVSPRNFGGLGLDDASESDHQQRREVLFLCEAWLESLNAVDRASHRPPPLASRPEGRGGMTLTEKIFALHDVGQSGAVKPGQVIRIAVDWIMASELSWGGMKKVYDQLGKPGIFRNDRFWLAGDHLVDPRVNDRPHIKQAIEESEEAKETFKMTEYQGLNVSFYSPVHLIVFHSNR